MKKFMVAVLMLAVLAFPSAAFASQEKIVVELDGKVLNVSPEPVTVNGRTLAPFRSIFEALGCTVGWDEKTETVSGSKDGTNISLVIGSTQAVVNGETKTLEVPARTMEGRTMVPVRFIAEALNCFVDWDGTNQKVIIKTDVASGTSGTGNTGNSIYAVNATGKYAGYRQLKGYPEENKFAVYVEGTYGSFHIVTEQIGFNPNDTVVWTNNGKTLKNTKAQVYTFFSDISQLQGLTNDYSSKYDSAWMSEKFGDVYTDWIAFGDFEHNAQRMVEQFLASEAGVKLVDRFQSSDEDKDVIDDTQWISTSDVEREYNIRFVDFAAYKSDPSYAFVRGSIATTKLYEVPEMTRAFMEQISGEGEFNGIRMKRNFGVLYFNVDDLRDKGVIE